MREIKFRVWDVDHKKWIKGLTYCIDDFASSNKEWHKVMQFTGLHDKNGREIYEGDIVKGVDTINPIRIIKWETDSASFTSLLPYKVIDGIPQYEIIGNIYENPELCK